MSRPCEKRPRTVLACVFSSLILVGSLFSACATIRGATSGPITVEGTVTVRGNEPFAAYVLETDDSSFYVLSIPDALLDGFATPARIRVTGKLYSERWQAREYDHVDVESWSRIE